MHTKLETPVQYVKGVGPKLSAVFSGRNIKTVRDLMTFFPRTYEDRSQILKVSELGDGEKGTLKLKILSIRKIPIQRGKRTLLEARSTDGTRVISLKWFHAPRGLDTHLTPGSEWFATGVVKHFLNQAEMVHPELNRFDQKNNVGRIIPIYVEIEGLPNRLLRNILWNAVEKFCDTLTEDLPEEYLKKYNLPKISDAIRTLHFPNPPIAITHLTDFSTPAHERLIYEEFFKFEYLVLKQRLNLKKERAQPLKNGGTIVESLEACLPFQLTSNQKTSIQEILSDLSLPHPMNRLIQGDVGSGKTAVAFLTAGAVLADGGQAALMAPTEILAEQHFQNSVKLFGGKLNTALLTGKTPNPERKIIHERLSRGEPLLLIGTHALIEDPVKFKNLSYVMIDEQHRFGVEQRRKLRHKGEDFSPHILILTATPIPRTLALTAYGDLTISTLKEMPPGRSPVITRLVTTKTKPQAYQKIREELKKGHQAYFIFPLVEESEAEGFTHLKAAQTEAEYLAKDIFPEFKVGLLHGQMRSDDKTEIMEKFKKNEIHVLASTTVVEVGVDVPNATVMVVEHAERFGFSQLHQLRGRVGRGKVQSYCFLMAPSGGPGIERLRILEKTNDGFKIAEADLELRGPGEFLGTRQSGDLPFRMANLIRDQDWLIKAREDVISLLKVDPSLMLPENLPLRCYFEREGHLQFERLKTG